MNKIESLNIETPFNRELMRSHFTKIIVENLDAETYKHVMNYENYKIEEESEFSYLRKKNETIDPLTFFLFINNNINSLKKKK